MKSFLLLLLFSNIYLFTSAQIFSVSDDVKKTFDLQYPNAKEVDWTGGLDNDIVQFRQERKNLRPVIQKAVAGIGQKQK